MTSDTSGRPLLTVGSTYWQGSERNEDGNHTIVAVAEALTSLACLPISEQCLTATIPVREDTYRGSRAMETDVSYKLLSF